MNLISKLFSHLPLAPYAFIATVLIAFQANSFAGEGHDHGPAPAASSSGQAAPRFEAHSDLFEVVGTLANGELSLLIDRYDTNAPVLQAQVELVSGSTKLVGAFHADIGDYSFPAKPFLQPGTYPITLTLQSGKDTDVLAGELTVPPHDDVHAAEASVARPWLRWSAYAALTLLTFVTLLVILRRRAHVLNPAKG